MSTPQPKPVIGAAEISSLGADAMSTTPGNATNAAPGNATTGGGTNAAPGNATTGGGTNAATSQNELKLIVPGVFDLSGKPREQYEMHITRVAKDVLKEASNLATARPEGSRRKQTEFHSDHVDRAFGLIADRGLRRKGRPGWYTWGRILQGVLTLATSGAAVLMGLPNSPSHWGYIFAGCLSMTAFLIVALEVADRSLAK
ncbi:hypothetical protein ACIGB6_01190 [Paeniglutamicibacter gangotriensis]|uniref:hypothetical protein n=1 Tax=Paeniglutamicibacter gangotriensis TaxID=254787 RepID=UPI0037C6606A